MQEVCSHLSSPALGEGTGWHGSLQGYPRPALLPPFQPPAKAPGSAVEQVLLFAVCPQGGVCPVPELCVFQLSHRCPPCGRWLRCASLISLSGAGEPGPVLAGPRQARVVQRVCGAGKGPACAEALCSLGCARCQSLAGSSGAWLQGQPGRGRGAWTWWRAADMARTLVRPRGSLAGAWGAGGGSVCPGWPLPWGCTPSRLAHWRSSPIEPSALSSCRAQQGGSLAELMGTGPQVQLSMVPTGGHPAFAV